MGILNMCDIEVVWIPEAQNSMRKIGAYDTLMHGMSSMDASDKTGS